MRRAVHRQTGALLWPSFGRGWQARVERIQRAALGMAGGLGARSAAKSGGGLGGETP
jgi:hypothetical protein